MNKVFRNFSSADHTASERVLVDAAASPPDELHALYNTKYHLFVRGGIVVIGSVSL